MLRKLRGHFRDLGRAGGGNVSDVFLVSGEVPTSAITPVTLLRSYYGKGSQVVLVAETSTSELIAGGYWPLEACASCAISLNPFSNFTSS